jgi:small conductance mechanosensitive channel
MNLLEKFLTQAMGFIPLAIAVAVIGIIMFSVRAIMLKRSGAAGRQFRVQMVMLILSFFGLIIVILTLPVSETTIGQLLSLFGILLSAAIALSATTFVGNIMAGLMLRAVKNFRAGDFIRCGEHFGRVSERGLFHVEIQNEDRDLTTLPNLFLVTNPVKVIRSSGTLITADVSLGYDIPRQSINEALISAAENAGLEEPFVHVIELGNFSITYRISGMLTEVKGLISARSRLREMMLDSLHAAGIEIVSPTFMNQRVLDPSRHFIPERPPHPEDGSEAGGLPEAIVFDKADEAESLEKLQERRKQLKEELDEAKKALDDADSYGHGAPLEASVTKLERRLNSLDDYIQKRKEAGKE